MSGKAEMSFWDHLEELRGTLLRALAAVALLSVVAFCFKDLLFGVVLAPTGGSFPLYRLMHTDFSMDLVNYDLSAQFFVHLKMALAAGFLAAFPVIIFEIWRFVAPGLYAQEKKALRKAFILASLFFYLGALTGYFLVLPFVLNFFSSYSVSGAVVNTISLRSYVSTFSSTVLLFGVVFEFPAVIAALSSLGMVDRKSLRKGRKYAVVASLVLGAIVTPADPLSMFVAAAPLYLLYEGSVLMCRKERKPAV